MQVHLSQLQASARGLTKAVAAASCQLLQQLAEGGNGREAMAGLTSRSEYSEPLQDNRSAESPPEGSVSIPGDIGGVMTSPVSESVCDDLRSTSSIEVASKEGTLSDSLHMPCKDCATPATGARAIHHGFVHSGAPPPKVRREIIPVASTAASVAPASSAASHLSAPVVRLQSIRSSPLRRPLRPEEILQQVARPQSPVRMVSQPPLHSLSSAALLPQSIPCIGVGSMTAAPTPARENQAQHERNAMYRTTLPRSRRESPAIVYRSIQPSMVASTPLMPASIRQAAALQMQPCATSRASTPTSRALTPSRGDSAECRRSSPIRMTSPVPGRPSGSANMSNQVMLSAAAVTARIAGCTGSLGPQVPPTLEIGTNISSMSFAQSQLQSKSPEPQGSRADALPNFGAADAFNPALQRQLSPPRQVHRLANALCPTKLVLPAPRVVKNAAPSGHRSRLLSGLSGTDLAAEAHR